MDNRDVFVVGASAGGVEALVSLVKCLPEDLPAAVFVVIHFPAHSPSLLPQILSRAGRLPAAHAADGDLIQPGKIYIAPPGLHLWLGSRQVTLSSGPLENGVRPAIDVLFRSAARAFGSRVAGVLLSGTLGDGAAGLLAIKRTGGTSIVQDPHEALYAEMPLRAIELGVVDHILPIARIAEEMVTLSNNGSLKGNGGFSENMEDDKENHIVQDDIADFEASERGLQRTTFTCPECGGVLWELKEEQITQYRCHVGHSYTPESLDMQQTAATEEALWRAVRALEESATLARRLRTLSMEKGRPHSQKIFDRRVRAAEESADAIRRVLMNGHFSEHPANPGSAGTARAEEEGYEKNA